jgi:hypothetical protein
MSMKEANWQEISSLVAEWMDTLAPARFVPSLKYRDKAAGKPEFSLKLQIPHVDIILKQMASLSQIANDIDDLEIAGICSSIPWSELKKHISADQTWEQFLQQVGTAFSSKLEQKHLKMIQEWVPKGVHALPKYRSEIKLLEILVKSTDLVKS